MKNLEAFHAFETAIGPVRVGWTDDGLSMISFLTKKRDHSELVPAKKLPAWVKRLETELKAHFRGHTQHFDWVPLDLSRCTDFQKKVYREASKLKPGQIISYGGLAKKIGRPHGARAVGRALGKNPVCPVVPCHRIVGKTGSLTGFSAEGGVEFKARLLQLEDAPKRPII